MSAHAARSIAPKHLSGQRPGVGAILDHDNAVDDDGSAASAGIAMRIRVSRAIMKVCGIKDCDVGASAFAQQPAVRKLARARACAGHLVHGKLERNDAELADVMADDAREGAVESRMRLALADRP